MSKKKQKQLFLMLGILAALVVLFVTGILLNRWNTRRQETAEDEATPRVVTMESVSAMTLKNGDTSLSFAKDDDGNWYWTEDADFPLDDSTLTSLESLAEDYKAEKQLEISDTLEAYGLEDSTQSLTLTDDDGSSTTILLGGATGENYYAMVEGGDSIYTVGTTLYDSLNTGLYDMAELADYPALSEDIIQSMQISGAKDETFTVQAVEVESEDTGDSSAASSAETDTADASSSAEAEVTTEYHWLRNGEDITDDSALTTFRTEVDSIAVDSLAYYKPDDAQRTACGLDDPAAVLTVVYTGDDGDVTSVLTIGGQDEESGSYYCTLDTNPNEIYLISSSTVENTLSIAAQGYDAVQAAAESADAE